MSEIFEVNEISVPTKDGAEVAVTPWFAAVFSTYGDAVHVLELLGLQAALAVQVPPYRHGRTEKIFFIVLILILSLKLSFFTKGPEISTVIGDKLMTGVREMSKKGCRMRASKRS